MRGDESAKEKGMTIIKGSVVFGAILLLAVPLVAWLTGVNVLQPENIDLPTGLAAIVSRLLGLALYLGAAILVFGLIYGGYQYKAEHPRR